MPDKTAAELVAGCRDGNGAAWDELVSRYSPLMWSIARGYRLSPADCEDVVQATWVRVLRYLGGLRDPDRIGQWIAVAARREALKHIKAGQRHVAIGDAEMLDLPGKHDDLPEDVLLKRERDAEVMAAFCGLSPRCQELLSMLMRDPPPSYDEASLLLGMPRGSIGPTRSRCLAQLEAIMKRRSEPPLAG